MIEQRIEQIKAKLVMEQPYFGSIASTLSVQQNDDLQTFQTKPALFEYNDEYIETLNDNQIAFTLTASAMHHALSYDERKENRMDWLWTLAQDYAINALLISNNLDAPPKINHDTRFDNMSSERIYKILESEIDEDKHTPQKVEKFKTQKEFQDQQLDDQTKDIHQQQLNKAKLHGDLPLGIEIVIPNIHEGEISWRDELHEMIEHSVKFDYSMFPPNKRYLWQGVALPSLSGNQLKLIIAIDSSGSIDDELLGLFLSEVESIMNNFENYVIDLVIGDAKVQEHSVLYPGDTINPRLKGGGGTNFEAIFEYIQNEIMDPSLVLYFTDGVGTFPKQRYNFDTIWVMNDENIEVPFGEKLLLKRSN